MDQDIEVLPSSSNYQVNPTPFIRRPVVGVTGSYGTCMLPSHRGAGAPPSLLRVERQLPLSFQRTNQHYDGSARQTVGASNGKVVLLPRVHTNGSGGLTENNGGIKRIGVPRGVMSYRVDAAGNRYVVTTSGQLARVQPASRMSIASAPLRRNYVQPAQRYQSDVKLFVSGGIYNENGDVGNYDVDPHQYMRQVGPYSAQPRQIASVQQRVMPTGFRRVDYASVRTSEYRRPIGTERMQEGGYQGDMHIVKRDSYDWPPRLVPVGGAPGGGYRVAINSPPPPTTRLRPVNPRRAFGQISCGGLMQIRAGDSPDTRVCKMVMRDILDEICDIDSSVTRLITHTQQHGGISSTVKQEVNEDDGRYAFDDRPQLEQEQSLGVEDRPSQWPNPMLQQRRFGDDVLMDDAPRARVRPRVSSPIARQIVSMRDVYELPFDQIARHFKLEPHIVRFAYIQLKKHSFRSVGRPRKSESEERRNHDQVMPFVSSGRMPQPTNQIGIPSPAIPLPARYTSDELNIFLEVYRKEVTKRRNALERRAEEETGIVMPWNRSRSKSVKTTKRQLSKKDANFNADDSFSLCDPRYISLGGNTVPFEEMPMKMELDLSGNAKITTQSDLLNNKSFQNDSNINATTGGSGANEENDESDDDDDNTTSNSKALLSKVSEEIGNDESENDSTTVGDGDTSAGEDMDYSRTAKFASLSTTRSAIRARNAPSDRMTEQKRVVLEKKGDREQKKTSAKKIQAQKSRAVGQQHRRDRERRIQMIQMRKMNSSLTDDNSTANTKMLKNKSAVAAVVKKSVRKSIFAEKDDKDAGPAKYCPCGGSYDPKKMYVPCKQCSRWYHCKCAGITEKRAQKMANDTSSEWTCPDCEKSSSAEVYCVCRRPYDDSRFYVGCDSCEDWFHPECIGTNQAEVSKHDTFLCPRCRDDI